MKYIPNTTASNNIPANQIPDLDYDTEKWALEYALDGMSDKARETLRNLTLPELDKFIDALDWLAAYADAEAIRRAEKRP